MLSCLQLGPLVRASEATRKALRRSQRASTSGAGNGRNPDFVEDLDFSETTVLASQEGAVSPGLQLRPSGYLLHSSRFLHFEPRSEF